jgi:tetratricopeptide (TPR) repeat protein
LQRAVELAPRSAECRYNLGRAFAAAGRYTEALPDLEAAAAITNHREPAVLQMLAAMYSENGRYQQAIDTAQHAVDLANDRHDVTLVTELRANLGRYQQQLAQSLSHN